MKFEWYIGIALSVRPSVRLSRVNLSLAITFEPSLYLDFRPTFEKTFNV